MNYLNYYLSRVLAFVAIGILMIGVQSAGVLLQQRKERIFYQQLGMAVCDERQFQMEWWIWPPQLRLSGRYRGVRFRYQKVSRDSSHLLVECTPETGWETSRHHPGRLPSGLSYEMLERSFPGWGSFYATRKPVPWQKRSLDRRPLGFGSTRGIDLYQHTANPFDPGMLRSDLEGLIAFCTETPNPYIIPTQ
jgi:hypothetical protein